MPDFAWNAGFAAISMVMRWLSSSTRFVILALAGATALSSTCLAQEIASVDLTKVEARVALRRPKATRETTGGYSGATSTTQCPDLARSGALETSLLSLDRTYYRIGDEPKFEVTIENTGSVPVRIPISPHLADLQPEDPAKKFTYYELRIDLWVVGNGRWSTNTGGSATLYGAENHGGTMLTLQPGEWIRVVASGGIRLGDDVLELIRSGSPATHAYAEATLFRSENLRTAKLSATANREVCLAQSHRQTAAIQISIE